MHNVVLSTRNIDELISEIAIEVVRQMELWNGSNPPQSEIDPNEKLTVQEAAKFLGITVPTLYSKNSLGELPSCKAPGTKRLFFFKKDLLDYMKQGRKLTNHEIQAEAVKSLTKKRKG